MPGKVPPTAQAALNKQHCGRLRAGKTLTAPLDRVKLLLQTRGGLQGGAVRAAAKSGGVWAALAAIGREEGLRGYWKGNIPQARLRRGSILRAPGRAVHHVFELYTISSSCTPFLPAAACVLCGNNPRPALVVAGWLARWPCYSVRSRRWT